MNRNPFVYYEPVKGADFINRERVIESIENVTFKRKQQGSVWLVGPRQSGKTSLLQRICRLYEEKSPEITLYQTKKNFKVQFIYFNCQVLRDADDFYRNLTQAFINYSDFKIKEKKNSYITFIEWLSKFYSLDKYSILMLDEFDAFIEKFIRQDASDAAHFLDTFNVLAQELPGLKTRTKAFGFVCASNNTFTELTKNTVLSGSGFKFDQEENLENFSKEQLDELIDSYLKENPVQFSPEEKKFCFQVTKGYPYFSQRLLSIIYDERLKTTEFSAPLSKKILNDIVKKEFIRASQKTLSEWKDQKRLTGRTIEKIKDFGMEVAVEVLKELPEVMNKL